MNIYETTIFVWNVHTITRKFLTSQTREINTSCDHSIFKKCMEPCLTGTVVLRSPNWHLTSVSQLDRWIYSWYANFLLHKHREHQCHQIELNKLQLLVLSYHCKIKNWKLVCLNCLRLSCQVFTTFTGQLSYFPYNKIIGSILLMSTVYDCCFSFKPSQKHISIWRLDNLSKHMSIFLLILNVELVINSD